MGVLDQIVGQIGGVGSGKGDQSLSLFSGLLEILGKGGTGGLSDVVKAFQAKGLCDTLASWVGSGANLPISPSQIQAALGSAGLQQLAQKVGLSPEATSSKLAEILPGTVDTLTPEGRLPEAGVFAQALGLLKGRLG